MRTLIALVLALAASGAQARVIAQFECRRPGPVDEGTLFNVALAARLVDGAVLEPGGQFSYNRALDPGRGMFKPGLTIRGGRFTQSVGGGYCQVSTAIYNAVVLAGLPVVERYNHSLYDPAESYVPAGLDAAVSNETGADFRFNNATPAPLTLSVRAEGGVVRVALLGRTRRAPRWVSTRVVERRPKRIETRLDPLARSGEVKVLRPGYDGLVVESMAHYLDAAGDTVTYRLAVDKYLMVPEVVAGASSEASQKEQESH